MTNDIENAIQNTARVAAQWWEKSLRGFQRSDAGDLVINLALSLTQRNTSKVQTDFEDALFEEILKRLRNNQDVYLDVDYYPDGILGEIARKYNVQGSFPVKTHMVVQQDSVTVACGYQAPIVRLLGKPIWGVESYIVGSEGRSDDPNSSKWKSLYRGTDEQQARKILAEALKAIPDCLLNKYDRNRSSLSLTKDGSYQAAI